MLISTTRSLVNNLKPSVKLKSLHTKYQEIRIPVPWGHIAGKWWGPTDQRPILTIHGWQDNCGSFNRLIPLLNDDVGFLAIDCPGHGYSSRIPSGLFCHFTDYLILIQHLINYFKWPKVSLMGHSMGGFTSFTYTLVNPKNVDFLICIDGAKPVSFENNIARMAKLIEKFPKLVEFEMTDKEPPNYTMEEIKLKLCPMDNSSVAYEHSHHIIERNVAPSKVSPGKYCIVRDPRLTVLELINMPLEEQLVLAKDMTCPVFICKAKDGPYYEPKKNYYDVLKVVKGSSVDCDFNLLDGTHHIHLNNPEILANLINKFIRRHNTSDRNVGGIKEEMKQFEGS